MEKKQATIWVPANDKRIDAAIKALEAAKFSLVESGKIASLMTANQELQKIIDNLLFRHLWSK